MSYRAARGGGDRPHQETPLQMVALIGALLGTGDHGPACVEEALRLQIGRLALSEAQVVRLHGSSVQVVASAGAPVAAGASFTGGTSGADAQSLAAAVQGQPVQAVHGASRSLWRLIGQGDRATWLLGWRRPVDRPFDEAEVQLAGALATTFAGCIGRDRLRDALRVAEEDSLRALAAALSSRDRYTGSHVDAVCLYAERVGGRLGLGAAELHTLRLGSVLHDIGKIGVADAVLQKVGPLTEVETMQMRQHTIIGAEIVRHIGHLQDALPVVLHHHERWDGRGYPSGLAGERIPLCARIVAVVDSFHAMTSTRPYRKAISDAEALDELRRCAGSQFDPAIVAAFSALISEMGAGEPPVASGRAG